MANPVFGSGKFKFQVVEDFFKRPKKWSYIDVADVAVDKDDNVYVFNRSEHPIMVFDKLGNFLDAWGEIGVHFVIPHGITIAPNGDVLTADTGDHTVRRWTKEGKLLLTLGQPNQNTPEQSGLPFNKPTHLAVAPNDDYYATDGYGNSHVHCFDPYGKLKFSWGGHGSAPGQFDCIHSIFIDYLDGNKLYITDRYNNRVQIFTPKGEFLGQWTGLLLANSVRRGPSGNFYVAELYHRITIVDPKGVVLARWGDDAEVDSSDPTYGSVLPTSLAKTIPIIGRVRHEPGAGLFAAPHGIAVDSQGSFYVAEVAESYTGLDRGSRNIQKFIQVK
ncbi:MAG: peptidyl-alpha-hydroxyglycine alpha-amidating lyase family protein [Dehalococcoidia bacterium]|nr:peptidyl-alpha-hydroxyglycine alpha-amidating lyase family protein [Dehalococcoidia bacterium]